MAVREHRADPAEGPTVVIEPMGARHLDDVQRIDAASYPRPWSRAMYESEITLTSTRSYWVVRVDEEVAGFAGLQMAGDAAHVTTVAVAPEHRRHGIATRLMLQLTDAALRRGASQATLEVRAGNRAAQRLYLRFGYAPVGVRRRYYPDSGEDAIIMTADSIDAAEYRTRLRRIARVLPGDAVVHPEVPPA